MEALTVWIQMVELNWRRSIRFYENRFSALRSLDEAGLVRQFRVHDHEVGARLGDIDHELELSVSGLRGEIVTPNGDPQRVLRAAEVALNALEIEDIQRMAVRLRMLVRLGDDYDKIRASSGAALFGKAIGSDGLQDWALLVDRQSGIRNTDIHYEFGIVSKIEVPMRLSGLAGQMGTDAAVEHKWDERLFPNVGLFVHGIWERREQLPAAKAMSSLDEFWRSVSVENSELIEGLIRGLGVHLEDGDAE